MNTSKIRKILSELSARPLADLGALEYLLSLDEPREMDILFGFADRVRQRFMGDGVLLRGIIEFSNHCRNDCLYCGLNRNNIGLKRYRMDREQVLAGVAKLHAQGVRTVVLQSGEEDGLDPLWLQELILRIKKDFPMAITLSLGERSLQDYRLWRKAGADRYLLKIETTDHRLYRQLHPGMDMENRLACLEGLKELGYQVGSGNIIGFKGQTLRSIAEDILFFQREDFAMIGIGPFIPHPDTRLGAQEKGNVPLVLKTLAITRIVTRNTHLPATTALGSCGADFRPAALKAGANVLMPNFTPQPYRGLYQIYPGKRCIDEPVGACAFCMDEMARSLGRHIDYSRGDSLKKTEKF